MISPAKRWRSNRWLLLLLSIVTMMAPVQAWAATVDVLYDGTVSLGTGASFSQVAYNSGTAYVVNENTPLGALRAAGLAAGFSFDVTDKNYATSGALLLDNVGTYQYVKGGAKWYAYVNDAFKDGYNNAAGALNLIELVAGDKVEYYYAAGIEDPANVDAVKAAATAAVKAVVGGGAPPEPGETDWSLDLVGAKLATVTKSYFEEGLACASSGHSVTWTDSDGNVWGGVPLWFLVGMVDDDPDVGDAHFNFNDELATENYKVHVIADDGWSATFESQTIAHNSGYIVANTLNGEPLPEQTSSGKDSWPLHLKGSAVFGGQQVGNIVKIELTDLPEPAEGWTLELAGDVIDTVAQDEFETRLATASPGYLRQWTDKDGNVWSGVPLWVLVSVVDDIEPDGTTWTFNDALATSGYTVEVAAADGFTRSFESAAIKGSDGYIIANRVNGAPLTDGWPLRLVGTAVTKADGSLGGSAVSQIAKISIPQLVTPAGPDSQNLSLRGKISDALTRAEFEAALACPQSGHLAEWTDKDGNVWSGMPLWFFAGWVDDREPHSFNFPQSQAGYTVLVKAQDGYTKEFASQDIANSSRYIIADKMNGQPLASAGPLRLVGAGVAKADGSLGGLSVGSVAEIELVEFGAVVPVPELRIVKFGADETTVVSEKTVDYRWMEANLPVLGDGVTKYRYEGTTNNPADVWDAAETYPGGFKIENAVKGTKIRDLTELVGGMGTGTEIVFVADDGYETRLPYASIYTNPAVQARQGDAMLAWWADGEYVPAYEDGMRLFFMPDDKVYGQWDMHESLPEKYWHYYFAGDVQYPSCAGLSAKYITEIRVYTLPSADWTLKLDGKSVGGLTADVNKTYFEQALACQFGADHKVSYQDSKGRTWEGMPLWFLAGYVDDADQHSDHSFNEAMATAGYLITVTAADGYSVTLNSKDIVRSNDYVVANTLNGSTIARDDSNWPLRLVGPSISGSSSISQIESIKLVKLPVLSDVAGHWAQAGIERLVLAGAVSGYPDGTFKPDAPITRAEFVTILVKAARITPRTGQSFTDTAGHWARQYIATAAGAGIVQGYNANRFGPDDLITREQMAAMLVRAYELELAGEPLTFADADDVSAWAAQMVATAVQEGIIKGYPDNTLLPQGKATRAEALTAISNGLGK